MKGLIFTFFIVLISVTTFSQTTYYWVGNANGIWTDAASWNTSLNGSGSSRTIPNVGDVMIFDGSNIGGAVPVTGTVTPIITGSFTIGQFHLQSAADVILQRNASGTSSVTVNGDGTATDDFTISTNSILTVKTFTGFGMNFVLGVLSTSLATGTISGTLNINDAGLGTSRVTVPNPASLFFASGSILNTNVSTASSYPFGSSSTSPAAAILGVVFQNGSTCRFLGGNSIFTNTSTFNPVKFNAGSTLEMNAVQPAGLFNSRTLANVVIKTGVSITLTETFYNIDTLNINSGATFNMRMTGTNPISGNIINNGTFGAAAGYTTTNLVFIGIVPQTITGSGTFNNIGNLSVGTDADLTLNTNLGISGTSTSSISGKLNAQNYSINGTGALQLRSAATANSMATVVDGSNTVTLNGAGPFAAANVAIGTKVTGDGIQPNTYIISTNSASFLFVMSKPATGNYPAFSANITIANTAPTLQTANTAGVDGSIANMGTRTFGTGTNYIFDAATITPFNSSSPNAAGNVTFNAAATTNKTRQNINGTLTLNAGIINIRSTDTLRITSGNAIGGSSFSSSKYFVTAVAGNNLGVLRIDNLPTTTTLFPVGTSNYYLPVSLTPANTVDHAVSVFEGVTEDGTPTGTPFTAAKKANVVDAVWIVNRPVGTGDCIMQLQWNPALEGSSFSSFSNSNMGIGKHNGLTWGTCLGTGDNTANTATALYSSFSPFGVGFNGSILASQLKSISAFIKSNAVEINWYIANEAGIQYYEIEKSTNKVDFLKVGTVAASGKDKYVFTDGAALQDVVYYRIKIVGLTGDIKYSDIIVVKRSGNASITLYPNPAVNNLNLSGLVKTTSYKIISATGQVVLQQKTTANSLSIDVTGLQKGLYFIEILSTDNTSVKQSFIKQ